MVVRYEAIVGVFTTISSFVEIRDPRGAVFAKGLARHDAAMSATMIGKRTAQLPEGLAPEVVHRDDLVMLPTG